MLALRQSPDLVSNFWLQGCKRPLTYDFMRNVVESLGRKVSLLCFQVTILPNTSMLACVVVRLRCTVGS